MKYGIPVRLSTALAQHARETAEVQDRSVTEQVEHWARLGQIVEATVLGSTIDRLKALSYDQRLPRMLAFADTAEGRWRAAALISKRHPVRYGTTGGDEIVMIGSQPRAVRGNQKKRIAKAEPHRRK